MHTKTPDRFKRVLPTMFPAIQIIILLPSNKCSNKSANQCKRQNCAKVVEEMSLCTHTSPCQYYLPFDDHHLIYPFKLVTRVEDDRWQQ